MPSSKTSAWRDNFAELKGPMTREEARVEASRCLYCYDAPCVTACPTHIDVPRFIRQIAAADPLGSGETILEANALGHSCARVCPVEVLCEGSCVYHDWQEKPIQIARLQRYATDAVVATGELPFVPGEDTGLKAAVIGAGPAGASCAAYLRRLGVQVTVFEKRALPGGLNTFGVAEYKMTADTALEEMKFLFQLGCSVVTGREIDAAGAQKLLAEFDAVFVGVGLGETRSLGIPGEDLPQVVDALGFIERVKAREESVLGSSESTVVIGGGNTAIDAATQSRRTGAKKVTMAYRRGPEDLSAYAFELDHARRDGVQIVTHATPKRVLGEKKVEGVEFVNGDGKSTFTVACDRVIKAIGQTKRFELAKAFGLKQDEGGRLVVDAATLKTSHAKVFAGGDAVNGGKEVVNAAADGKRAAWGIWRTLKPGVPAPDGNDYWISTIDIRRVAPIQPRSGH